MNSIWFLPLKILLSVELAFAGSTPIATHVEQVSAQLDGRTYNAQITQVVMPMQDSKNLVVNQITVADSLNGARQASSVALEAPVQLNGTSYRASVPEPLSPQTRTEALNIAANQVDWVRRGSPAGFAAGIENFPAYGAAIAGNTISMTYSPGSEAVRTQAEELGRSAVAGSSAAFAGIQAQERATNIDAAHFANTIQQGLDKTVELRQAAERSDFRFTQSMNGFAQGMTSLHDRETRNLAARIAQADPWLQNVLSSGEQVPSADIRRETVDVSPLNPNQAANVAREAGKFRDNGLLSNGLFAGGQSFPPTPLGHRILESANLLSDAVFANAELMSETASRQLVGASFLYLNAAMKAAREGRDQEATAQLAAGRRIARALRGEAVPDDLEGALANSRQAMAMHEQALRETMGLRGAGRELLKDGFAEARPTSEEARVAVQLGSALTRDTTSGLSEAQVRSLGLTLLDVGLGLVPVVGGVKSLLYMVAGKNLVTGEKLTALDYTLCAIDVLLLGESSGIINITRTLPEAYGAAKIAMSEAFKSGSGYVKNFGSFVGGSVQGIRDIERVAPGFALKSFSNAPGAVLALGQNVTKYGGQAFAKDLIEYSARNAANIGETAAISAFGGGFSKVVTASTLERAGSQAGRLAAADGGRIFVASTVELDQAMARFGSKAELGRWLGLNPAQYEKDLYIVNIKFDLSLNPRIPAGSEAGVNEFFRSGGKTIGGARELVIDPVLMSQVSVRKVTF